MRWIFLGVTVGGFASLWTVGPWYGMFAAFIVMFVNFATFCLLYDRPLDQARLRVSDRLAGLHPNSDMAQRLSTAPIEATSADRHLGLGPMTLLNLGTGIAGAGLFVWGVVLRVS